MSKTKNFFMTLAAAAALWPAGLGAQTPLQQSAELLSNGTTIFLTATPMIWQNDDWSYESNIARDVLGNVYVAGSYKPYSDETTEIFVRKISPGGTVLWTSTMSATVGNSGMDYARGVALDGQGFLYALGVAANATQDVVVAKYNMATGAEQWSRVYDSGDSTDNAYDIAADATGAYVAGTSQNDITLWKFLPDNSGAPSLTRFNGGDSFNAAYGVAVRDNVIALAGFIYDGRDYNDPNDLEYGSEIWVARYAKDTLAHVWASTYAASVHPEWGSDEAHAVKLDPNYNIYAAGFYYSPDSGQDIWLGKFDTSGNLVFDKTKNGPSNGYDKAFGLALDAFGNIYVAGKMEAYSLNQGDNAWLGKYSPAGALLSEISTHRNNDSGYDVEVSTFLVTVGGAFNESVGVLNISQDQFGAPQQLFAGPGWYTGAVNVFWNYEAAGDYDYEVRYATYPSFAWGEGLAAAAGSDAGVSGGQTREVSVNGLPVWLDHSAGANQAPRPVYYFKVRLSSDSGSTWTPLTNTAASAPNAPYNYWNETLRGQDKFWVFNNSYSPSSALVRDASNNTYVAYGNNMGGVAIVKFNQYGIAQWTSFYNHADLNGRFVVYRMKLDGQGNIYAVGTIADQAMPGTTAPWIAKFSPQGIKLWDDVSGLMMEAQQNNFSAIEFDAAGKVYAGGEVFVNAGDSAMLMVKYEPARMAPAQQWISSAAYNPTADAPDAIWGLAADGSGNLFAGGFVSVINGSAMVFEKDSAIVKFDTSLGVQDSATFGANSNDYVNGQDAIADLAVSGGYIYAAGQKNMDVAMSTTSFWVAKIDPADWSVAWSDAYNSSDQLDAAAFGLEIAGGYLYAAGFENRYYPPDGQKNMVLRKYDLSGAAQWTKAVDGAYQNENVIAYGLKVGGDGYFYLAGVFNMWSSGEGNPGIARVSEPQSGIMAQPGYKPCSVRLSWVADAELPQGTTFYVHYATYPGVAFDGAAAQYSFYSDHTLFNGDYLDRLVPGLEAGNGAAAPGQSSIDSPAHYFKLGYKRPSDVSIVAVSGSTSAVPSTPGVSDRMDRYPNGSLFVVNNAHGGRNPLVRDAAGNIYTAGTYSAWGWGSNTAYVRKFGPAGQPLWTRFYSDQYENSMPVINALALDAAGNLYAAGAAGSEGYSNYYPYGPESATKKDALLIKYGPDGRMHWARTYDFDGAGTNDEFLALAAGPGYVYAAGKFYNSVTTTEDGMVAALNSAGATQYLYVTAETGDDVFNGLSFDTVNNRVYAAGRMHNGADFDGFVKVLNVTAGDLGADIIVSRGYEDELYAVRADTANAVVYLAGAVDDGMGSQDAYLAQYPANSQSPAWERTYNSANQNSDEAYGLALDGLGGVYLSGSESRYDVNQARNVFIRKYNTDGDLMWAQSLNSGSSTEDTAGGLAADQAGGVYAAVDAGYMGATGAYGAQTGVNGAGYFKHVQFNMNVVNPRLTVRVNRAPNSGIPGARVAVMGFSSTGGIDPNGISLGVTDSSGAVTMALPGGKSYFVAVSSHNMVPTIKDQLSDPGGNFFVELNSDATRQYYISPRSSSADAVHKMAIHLSNLTVNDYVMGEVFINQTGERVGYSVIKAAAASDTMEIYNLPAAENGVYGMAVSVPARNKVLQLFMDGPFPSTSSYVADINDASQLTGSFEVGASTVPPSVAGMVVDFLNGSPLQGARVRLERWECTGVPPNSVCTSAFGKETLTDAGGSFSFYNVPFANNYNINVGKAGYESGYGGFNLTAPPPGTVPVPYTQQFQLNVATYSFTGVLKYNGVPLPNATIMVNPDWMTYGAGNDSYRQGQYGGAGIRTDARVRTGADGSFAVTGMTDGNARIEAAFEGGWRSLNEGNSDSMSDNLRVTISSQGAAAPASPANNQCRPGRVWVVNSSGACVTAGSVSFNIIPENANSGGQLYGTVTFITTYTVTAQQPLVISTSSPLTLMAQESCRDGCKSAQMSFISLSGSFVSNTTSYTMVLSTGVTYYARVFSADWAKANSFDSEVSPSESVPAVRQDFSVVKAGGIHGVVKLPDGTNFTPVWGMESSTSAYWGEIELRGVNVDVKENKQINEYGEFEFPNLAPGVYSVAVQPRGGGFIWAQAELPNISVTEGRTTEVNLQLESGLAVRPQIFGLPDISTSTWVYGIVGVKSGTEMNQKKITELFFSEPEYSFDYSTSTGWGTKYMPAGQYDFYLMLASRYDPCSGGDCEPSYQQFANFIGRVKGVSVQKSDSNPNVGTAAQPIAVNILGSIGQAEIAGTVQGANMFTDADMDRMFANFNELFPLIPAVMLYDSAGDLRGFASAMPDQASFAPFETALMAQDKAGMRSYLSANPLDYGIWGLPPGRYTAVFANPNYPPVAKEIMLPDNASYVFDFDAQEVVTAGISGVVVSSSTGLALEGARVYLKHRTVEKFTMTNAAGAFSFSNLPTGIYRLEVSRNGYVTVGEKTSLAANDAKTFSLRMLPSESAISGRIFMSKFPTQVTKAGVEVVAYDETENVNNQAAYLPKTEVQTDSSGNFSIPGVVPGHLYKLSAFYTGKLPEVLEVTAQDGNTVISDITLKDIPPQITIKVKKSADSNSKVDVTIKSPKQLIATPVCRYNPGQVFDAASAVTLALVPGPNRTYLGQFTVSSSQRYYTVKVTAGDGGNKMEKEFVYDQVSNAKTEQYIQQESLAGGAIQMDKESEEYSGIELDPGALSYSTVTTGAVDYSNLVGGFFSALPSVRTVKTDKGNLTITAALQALMASEVYNMDLSNASANKQFTLTLKYDKERGAASSQNLRIYQQDADGNWKEIPGNYTVDPMLGVLSVDVASLTNASEGTSAAGTPLGRKRFGMSAVVNGRYVPSAASGSQSGRFAVFTAKPGSGVAYSGPDYEVYNLPNPFNLKDKTLSISADGTTNAALFASGSYVTRGTLIKYHLPSGRNGRVKFVIYNAAGEKVRTIDDGSRTGGEIFYSEWDGKNDANQDCASGVYFMLTYVNGEKLGAKAHKLAIIK